MEEVLCVDGRCSERGATLAHQLTEAAIDDPLCEIIDYFQAILIAGRDDPTAWLERQNGDLACHLLGIGEDESLWRLRRHDASFDWLAAAGSGFESAKLALGH